jgi:excisionase family DNA binding protein
MTTQLQTPNDRLLRKKEAAAMLACSVRTIERDANCGRLTPVRVRSGVRFRFSEVQAIIKGNGL